MAREIHLIVVGKYKDLHLESIEKNYLKRINNPSLIIHEVKCSSENKDFEGQAIIRKVKEISQNSNIHLIALTEWGNLKNSVDFSAWISNLIDRPAKIIFMIAGAEGFSDEVLKQSQERISLSQLTFPHKLARIILVEQLYRAQTLRSGHPYHN